MMRRGLYAAAILILCGCGSSARATGGLKPNRGTGGSSEGGADASGGQGGFGGKVSMGGDPSSGGTVLGGASSGGTGGSVPDHCDSDVAPEPVGTFQCATNLEFLAPSASNVPLEGGSVLAIATDETTFLTKRFGSSSEEFFLLERADLASDFGAPVQLLDPEIPLGLSPDGLTMFVVDATGSILSERARAAKFDDFDPPSSTGFQKLNLDANANGYQFRDVVISSDGKTLVYSANADAGHWAIFIAERQGGGPWDVGTRLSSCEFGEKSGFMRRPIRLSEDALTLFYADEVRGIARAAYRETTSTDFTYFRDFPGAVWLSPNQSCDVGYWMQSGVLVTGGKKLP